MKNEVKELFNDYMKVVKIDGFEKGLLSGIIMTMGLIIMVALVAK